MVLKPGCQGKRITILQLHGLARTAATSLFEGHTDGPVVDGISISIGRIKQVEAFTGEIEPSLTIEIPGIVLSDQLLEFTLPWGDHFMIGLCSRCEIIR